MTDDPYRQYDPRQYPPPSGYPAPEQPDQPAYPPTQPYPTGQPAGGGQYYGGGYYGGGPHSGGQYSGGQYGGGQYGGGEYYGGGEPAPGGGEYYGGGQPASGGYYGGGQYGGGYPDQYGAGGYPDQYGAGGQPSSWPAADQSPPPRRRRTGLIVGLVAGGLALVLCLGGIAFVALRVVDRVEDPAGGGDPFADTPAASFAEGADGIQLPEPEAVGDFSAEQVADTLDRVKEALVATRLEPAMLVDRDPEPFLSMMSEDNRPLLRDDFESGNFKYFASQLADGAELAEPSPRVEGEVTFEATRDEGNLRVIEVVTSFVWAYAFEVPDDNPELDGVVVVRDRLVWQVAHEEDVRESSMGLWLWDGEAFAWGIDCTAFADGLLSPQTEPGPEGEDPGDPADVFDPSAGAPDLSGTC